MVVRSPARAQLTWLEFDGEVEVRVLDGADASSAEGEAPATTGSRIAVAGVPEDGLELELRMPAGELAREGEPEGEAPSGCAVRVVDQIFARSPRVEALRAALGGTRVARRSGDTVLVLAGFSL